MTFAGASATSGDYKPVRGAPAPHTPTCTRIGQSYITVGRMEHTCTGDAVALGRGVHTYTGDAFALGREVHTLTTEARAGHTRTRCNMNPLRPMRPTLLGRILS